MLIVGICLCVEEVQDVLAALGVTTGQTRVTEVVGRCGPLGSRAFRLADSQESLGVQTAQLFPTGFPSDFSLLAVVRLAANTTSATLFSLYRYHSYNLSF